MKAISKVFFLLGHEIMILIIYFSLIFFFFFLDFGPNGRVAKKSLRKIDDFFAPCLCFE